MPFLMVGITAVAVHLPQRESLPDDPETVLAKHRIERTTASTLAAATAGNMLILRLLQDSGMDLDDPDKYGRTPLMAAAAAADNDEIIRWLIEHGGVALETTDRNGLTAMAHAVEAGRVEHVEQLAAAGAELEAPGGLGLAPILFAAGQGDTQMLNTLFGLGARVGLSDAVDRTVRAGELGLADFLLTKQRDLEPSGAGLQRATLLDEAVREADVQRVALLLRHDAPLEVPDAAGVTPLGAALDSLNAELCAQLLAAGAAADAPCSGDLTPLELAWQARDLALAKLLLENGASPHPGVLHAAAAESEPQFVRLLALRGAPLGLALEDGDTLLTSSLAAGDVTVARELLEIGASPEDVGKEGQAALALATARKNAVAVRLLLDAGANPNRVLASPVSDAFHKLVASETLSYYMKRDSRFTPIMVAAAGGDGDTIRALLGGGASKGKYTRKWKRYPIAIASQAKNIEAQQLLVGHDPKKQKDTYRLVISLSDQRVMLYKNGKPLDSSTVSTGKKGYRTPTGKYVVTHKHRDHKSTLYDSAPMPYFMRFSCSAFGTHAGYCPGYPASHGCIRMPSAKAKQFFNTCPTGTTVSIVP